MLALLFVAAAVSTPNRPLADVSRVEVRRVDASTIELRLDVRDRMTPPCARLGGVRVDVEGARLARSSRGGARWTMHVSPGFPVPMPQRACSEATFRFADVHERVVVTLADSSASWTLEMQVPPVPACRIVAPRDRRIAPGDEVRIACTHDGVEALRPSVLFRADADPAGARPALRFAGDTLAFDVPADWPTERGGVVRVMFPTTTPVLTRVVGPARSSATSDLHAGWRELPVRPIR